MKKHYFLWSALLFTAVFAFSTCGGGGGSSPPPTPPFSQADLTGTWYVSLLQSSPTLSGSTEPGWIRGTGTVSSSGNLSIPTLYTNGGSTSGPTGIVWKIDPWTGIISESGGAGNPDFHGKLAANKQLIVGTATNLNSSLSDTTVQLRIMQKVATSATYTISDIADKTFMVHQIESGAGDEWMYAAGSSGPVYSGVSTTGTLSTPITTPSGTKSGGEIGLLSLSPAGIITLDTNPSFQGMVSADKTYMVATETSNNNSNVFRLTVIQFTSPAPAYVQADLAGTWSIHTILSSGAWVRATATINAAGDGTLTSWMENLDPHPVPPTTFTLDLATDGTITDSTDPTLHGFLSPGDDLWVMTQTMGPYGSSMSIIVK